MSRYGQLYETAAGIRRQLLDLLPGELVGNYTPADAKRIVREVATRRIGLVDHLAATWEALEEEMKKEEG